MHNRILSLIKEQHQTELNFKEDVYYLILKDGVATVFVEEETKTLKIEIEETPEEKTYVYFNQDTSLMDLFDAE
ncbi:hypothetical protein [Pontibacillus salipaludis]|uniref:Uncharacterized protein n=1 Tax=Pontibacillus salipaludis TaxID=1697394 RepID=A0ABQ1PWM3_9BACI|nr:hypothetical protein [Pontibacillus salipaludis]GGD05240.1 hypothetical protein GCM10011389_10940 [Pontibacillus salipaludis]